MVQLYSPPAVRGLSSRLQDSSFEERATERVWTVRMQYRVAGTGVTQLLTECPQTLMEVDSNEEADLQAGTQPDNNLELSMPRKPLITIDELTHDKPTIHYFELPSDVSIAELDDLLLWFKGFSKIPAGADVKGDKRVSLIFPSSLTKQDRALLHSHAQEVGLTSESMGVAAARHITITVSQQCTGAADIIPTRMSTLTCCDTLEPPIEAVSTEHSTATSSEEATGTEHKDSAVNPAILEQQQQQQHQNERRERKSSKASAEPSATTSGSKLAGSAESFTPVKASPDSEPVGSQASNIEQGRRQKQAAGGAAIAVRGQSNGRGMQGRSGNGVHLSFADELYAWCCEAGGGYLEYSRGELQELVAAGGQLPPPLQQLSDLRACGDRLFKHISLGDEAGAIAVLETSPPAVLWLKDNAGCAPVHRAAHLGLLAVLEVLIEMQPGLLECRDYNYWNPLQVATHAGQQDAMSLIMQRMARLNPRHQQHTRQQQQQQQQQQGFYQQQPHPSYNQQMVFSQQGLHYQQQQQQQQGIFYTQQQQQWMYNFQQGQNSRQQGFVGSEDIHSQQQQGRYSSSPQGGDHSATSQSARQQRFQQNTAKKQQQHSDMPEVAQAKFSPSSSPPPQQQGPNRASPSPPPPPARLQQQSSLASSSISGLSQPGAFETTSTAVSPNSDLHEQRLRNNSKSSVASTFHAGQQEQQAQNLIQAGPRQARQPRQQGSSKTASTPPVAGSHPELQLSTQIPAAEEKSSSGGGYGGSVKANRSTTSLPNSSSADQLHTLPSAIGTDSSGAPLPSFYKDAARVVGRADKQNGWRRTEPLPPSPPPPMLPTGEAGGEGSSAGGAEDVSSLRGGDSQAPKTPPPPTSPPPPTGFTFARGSRLQPPPGHTVALPDAPGSSPGSAPVMFLASLSSALLAAPDQ